MAQVYFLLSAQAGQKCKNNKNVMHKHMPKKYQVLQKLFYVKKPLIKTMKKVTPGFVFYPTYISNIDLIDLVYE